jgi:hypothetical protein
LFLDQLGMLTRIVNISGLTLKGREGAAPDVTIDASFVATTFVLIEVSEPAVPGTKAI